MYYIDNDYVTESLQITIELNIFVYIDLLLAKDMYYLNLICQQYVNSIVIIDVTCDQMRK